MTAQNADTVAAAAPRKRRRKLDAWAMDVIGNEWCGNGGPPLDHRSVYVYDDGVYRVFSMLNDGHEVGIGYPDEWHVIMRRKAVRMLAWWTFKLWVTDWFGLRSALWYRALHHKVKGEWKLRPYPNSNRLTRWSSYDEWRESHAQSDGGDA